MSPWFFYNQRVRDISFPTHSLTVILSLWEKAPRMLRVWKVDEFNVLLYLGSQSRRRTETTLRHQDTPSCQIWKVVHRTVTHWRIAASLHEEEVAISLAFMSTHIFCCFYCSPYVCWAISQSPKEDRRGMKPQKLHGWPKTSGGIGIAEAKVHINI